MSVVPQPEIKGSFTLDEPLPLERVHDQRGRGGAVFICLSKCDEAPICLAMSITLSAMRSFARRAF